MRMTGKKGNALRVAMISEHASPLADPGSVDSGGQNVYVAQVARHLARQGFKVDVFTRRDRDTLPDIQLWEDGVRVIHVPAGPPEFVPKEDLLPHMKAFTDFMLKFIERQGQPYHLIHAHFWMSALIAADIKQVLGIPFVVTFHALGRVRRKHQGQNDKFPSVRFSIEDRVVAEADRIIAECPQDDEDLQTLYRADPQRTTIIPCGFDGEEMKPVDRSQARQKLGLPQDEWLVLQVGRMVPRKGVDNVIQGFARLVKQYGAKARLVIVGGSSEKPDPALTPEIGRLQSIARQEGVLEQVIFAGRRSRAQLKYYYSAADVFVSTPWYEPFGITPIEAMACGTPVIGSRVGGIQYTVEDGVTGALVSPNNPRALGDRLAYLYENPRMLQQMGRQAVQRANQYFTWKKVSQAIGEVYREVVEQEQEKLLAPAALGNLAAAVTPQPAAFDPRREVSRAFSESFEALQRSRKVLEENILQSADAIYNTLAGGGKVLVCGNGGSAADAQHFAGEFVGRFLIPGRASLPVMALAADIAFLTAWSNDVTFDEVYSRQVEAFGQPGDLLVAISTSGRSANLVHAFEAARSRGMTCLALLGKDGGDLLPLADIALVVPSDHTPRIQEVHLLVLHMLCDLVEKRLVSEQALEEKPLPANALLAPVSNRRAAAWRVSDSLPAELQGKNSIK